MKIEFPEWKFADIFHQSIFIFSIEELIVILETRKIFVLVFICLEEVKLQTPPFKHKALYHRIVSIDEQTDSRFNFHIYYISDLGLGGSALQTRAATHSSNRSTSLSQQL